MPKTSKREESRRTSRREALTRSTDKAEQILQGALPEFLKHGYACTSMDKVAQAAGVSKQTLYSYFSDKEGLFTALVKRMACQKFKLVWSQPLEGKPEIVLRELAYRLLGEVDDPDYLCFLRLIVAESGTRPDLAQLFLSNIAQPALKILTRYFQEHPEINLPDSEATARIFVGAIVHFILTQEMLHGKEIMPMEKKRLVDSLIYAIAR
ncbi:TetR/AcrR family transcriptional regulator [Hydrococcus rivularis]|uniref:TetR/AcrR family transcriptional regulator n=1 Tax=Hydrococcus rivularis TaxID=1616834 RepID=UPI000A512B30|nr:TetR/AcrR family transcriptional regulator [Hydrococcus rivularis]